MCNFNVQNKAQRWKKSSLLACNASVRTNSSAIAMSFVDLQWVCIVIICSILEQI